jgi:pimeloyl-ACP methyl ester carboxylesterase
VSAEYLDGYAALVPNARTMTVAKAGHAPQVEQPDALAAAVLDFLEA